MISFLSASGVADLSFRNDCVRHEMTVWGRHFRKNRCTVPDGAGDETAVCRRRPVSASELPGESPAE